MNDAFRYDMVILDVGGTLIGFHEWKPFQEFLSHVGLPDGDEDARRLHRRLISTIIAERDGAQGLGANEEELSGWWRGNFAKVWPDRPDLAEEMLHWLYAGRFDRLFGDVVPALRSLREMGLPLAVLSNFGTHLCDVLRRFELLDYFDFVLISAVERLAKPDRRIFDLLADRAKRPRHRLLYVGDHIGDDIEGAWGAGLDAVLIDRGNRQPEALCPRIASLLELRDYVRLPTGPARAIIFDMDGVVLDSMPTHLLSWQRALAPLGIELTASDLYPLEGVPTERTGQQLVEQALARACTVDEARRLAQAKLTYFRQMFNPTLVRGIVPLLYDLRGRGYRLGLVTGSPQSVVDESLAPTGVAELFDIVISGDQVSKGKPDPEPYQTAAAFLNVPPSQCLVVENAPLGIRSAKAAGMSCVALTTTLPAEQLSAVSAPAAPDAVFPDTGALRAWLLARWLAG